MADIAFVHQYFDRMKSIQRTLLDFLEDEEEFQEENVQKLVKYFDEQNIRNNKHELKSLLHLISNISENHHRGPNFFRKIDQILKSYQKEINENFSNFSVFNIFKKNKRIILFLLKEKILIPEKSISLIISSGKYLDNFYPHYFYPEFKYYFNKEMCNKIDSEMEDIDTFEFKQKREIGENDKYVCQLIQNDSIDDFITYINRYNLSLKNSIIQPSIFETNSFLFKRKEQTLIEYATFFGSFQIFKYLQLNNIELTPSLWLYAIHGQNPEIIHILEDNHVDPEDKTFIDCYLESAKCHHNDFMNYILENHYKIENNENILAFPLFYNFFSISDQFTSIDHNNFFDFCKYDYYQIVKFFVKNKLIDLNSKIILNVFFLLMPF